MRFGDVADKGGAASYSRFGKDGQVSETPCLAYNPFVGEVTERLGKVNRVRTFLTTLNF